MTPARCFGLVTATMCAGVGVLGVLSAAPARADDDSPQQQVMELVGPVAMPACDNAVAVTTSVTGDALAPVRDQVLVLCGSVPEPSGRRTCQPDAASQALYGAIVASSGGRTPPLTIAPAATVSEAVLVVEDQSPAPGVVPLAPTVDGVLACTTPPAPLTTAPAGPAALDSGFQRDGSEPLVSASPLVPNVDEPALPEAMPVPVAAAPAALVRLPRFAYPVVLALPLVFLTIAGFAANALTRPLEEIGDRT